MYISLKVRIIFVGGQSYQYVTVKYNKVTVLLLLFCDRRSMIRDHNIRNNTVFN